MADEPNDSNRPNRRSNMDLNLYLGLPRSPRRARPDLGSDLALAVNSPSSSSVASIEDSNTPINGSSSIPVETAESHPPYSPNPHITNTTQTDNAPNSPEYTPYFPSYETFAPSSSYPPPLMDHHPLPLPPVHELEEASNPSLMIIDDPNLPYSPPYVATPSLSPGPPAAPNYIPLSSGPEIPNEDMGSFSFYPRPPLSPPLVSRPELRFRRLIETSHRLRARRFRSSPAPHFVYHGTNVASPSTVNTATEALPSQPQTSLAPCEIHRKDKVKMELQDEDSNKDSKEKALESLGANFECNICFEMANEPVVTSCGHLFCWPCLYQWLHLHSDHKECPVCKGEVTEANLTPIYGRGNADSNAERVHNTNPNGEDGSGLALVKIPPRPHGNRVESFRQQFRPVSRRFGEGIASMRRILERQGAASGGAHRFDSNLESSVEEVLQGAQRRVLTRLRARRLQQRDESNNNNNGNNNNESNLPAMMVDTPVNPALGLVNPSTSSSANPNPNSDSLFRDGIDLWHRFSLYGLASTERLAVLTADLGRVVNRFASMSNNNNSIFGASSSGGLLDPSSLERSIGGVQVATALAADQVSASSTMAVIQGEAGMGMGNNSDGPGSDRPNSSGGSSRAQRRRVRGGADTSGTPGTSATAGTSGTAGASTLRDDGDNDESLDVDGEPTLHARKRRRLN